jgi:leader peptidase (prepilin peptidase)/N-methyltransferase
VLSLVVVAAGIVGLAIGSFLTVVVHRVPAGASTLAPRSACPMCAAPIRAIDNIPVLSYLLRRGRCHSCHAPIPLRYPALELTTAALFVVVGLRVSSLWMVPAYCTLFAALIALSAIDLEHLRVPSRIIYAAALAGLPLLVLASAATHRWDALVHAVVAGLVAFCAFFAIVFVSPKAMGFGDVRLAALCGAFLGWIGFTSAMVGFLLCFLAAGLVAVALLSARRTRRSARLPLAPFMSAGTVAAVLFGPQLAAVWLH